jgi:hypothetical protein
LEKLRIVGKWSVSSRVKLGQRYTTLLGTPKAPPTQLMMALGQMIRLRAAESMKMLLKSFDRYASSNTVL